MSEINVFIPEIWSQFIREELDRLEKFNDVWAPIYLKEAIDEYKEKIKQIWPDDRELDLKLLETFATFLYNQPLPNLSAYSDEDLLDELGKRLKSNE